MDTPSDVSRGLPQRIAAALLAFALHLTALLAILAVLVLAVPYLRELYAEMNLPLSPLVQSLVMFSEAAIRYWYAFLGMGLVADVIAVGMLSSNRYASNNLLPLLNYAVLLCSLLLVALMFCALMKPFE